MSIVEKKHVVVKDRVEIYLDFVLSLNHTIHEYYFDRVSLCEDDDIYNHFIWCYNRVCVVFLEEDIDFRYNDELIDYFFNYYYNQFYISNVDQETSISYFEKFWRNVFNYANQKNKNILNVLVEIYVIFDESINQKKK